MVKRNITIAVIIIVLFLLLAIAGFAIWAVQTGHFSFGKRGKDGDEESADGG